MVKEAVIIPNSTLRTPHSALCTLRHRFCPSTLRTVFATPAISTHHQSFDVVGYNQNNTDGVQSFSGGAMFIPVGGGNTVKLGEWKAEGMDADMDCIQFLKDEDATTEFAYTFVSKQFIIDNFEPADEDELKELMELYAGWWKYGKWDSEDRETYGADNKDIPVGKGFLTLNMSKNDVTYQYAGEAPTEQTFVTISGQTPMLCNYIPRDIILDEVTVENMDADMDCFQKLNSDDATTVESYTYVSRQFIIDNFEPETQEELDEYVALYGGWWQYGKWDSEDRDTYGRGTRPFNGGASFLGLMMSGNTMKVWFPSSIPAVEPAE